MPGRCKPCRNVRTAEDLLLIKQDLSDGPVTISLPADPHYAEICAWVNVRCQDPVNASQQPHPP